MTHTENLIKLIEAFNSTHETTRLFLARVQGGSLSRDENPQSHFCVYFAAHDPATKELFLGHHKKSGLWIFNGGHLDKGETPNEAVTREMREEWGRIERIYNPSLLTITKPHNPGHPCRQHFDIWYFVSVARRSFHPDLAKLAAEFLQTAWTPTYQARHLVTDENTIRAINLIEASWSSPTYTLLLRG